MQHESSREHEGQEVSLGSSVWAVTGRVGGNGVFRIANDRALRVNECELSTANL